MWVVMKVTHSMHFRAGYWNKVVWKNESCYNTFDEAQAIEIQLNQEFNRLYPNKNRSPYYIKRLLK